MTLKYDTFYDEIEDYNKLFDCQKELKVGNSCIKSTLFENLGATENKNESDLIEKGKAKT